MGTKEDLMPKARTEDLEVQELGDELLVYDLRNHRAHRLNLAAALVWRRCDGKTPIKRVTELLQRRFGLPASPLVLHFALRRLSKKLLLLEARDRLRPRAIPSRRELIKKLGLATTALLPAVSTLVAPPPAYAQSCLPQTACVAGVNDCAPCQNPGGNCGNNSWRCCNGACVPPGRARRCGC
jgi:hypothetical protein